MTVDASKSTAITNATATPRVLTNGHLIHGQMCEAAGTITPTAAAEADSTYMFCRVPSNARISEILLKSAAFTAGVVSVGVYQTPENGGAVVDADLFAVALDLSGAQAHADITHQSGEYTVAEAEKMLWQVLGLSADSQRDYDIGMIVTTAFDVGVAMHMKVRWAE
jgi:hypothetical protein